MRPQAPTLATLHDVLLRVPYCLALQNCDFAKTAPAFLHRLDVMRAKVTAKANQVAWSFYLVLHSHQFAEHALRHLGARRVEILAELKKKD